MGNIALRDGHAATGRGREFWRGALLGGGFTALPRWTRNPVPGVCEHGARLGGELTAALRGLATLLSVPLDSVLLTAHAKVLAALSGERELITGCAVDAGAPLPLRLTIGPGSWRELVLETARARAELESHKDFPMDELRSELGLSAVSFEIVLQLAPSEGAELAEGTLLGVGFLERDDGLALRLRFGTDALDCEAAARIAGYHVTALALIAADPDAEHARQSLLSPRELRFQLDGLAGPSRKLPDRPVHKLIEERARMHPNAVAAVHGDTERTYGELDARANRLARALLARGLCPEGVVAVVTERNLDWMTAVLAIFKAGGAYLALEPQFPAERVARMLSQARCRLVLTASGSTSTLDQALDSLSGIEKLAIDAACGEGHADRDPGVDVAPGQLAYIYFTSGSTGEPKGAMCEHKGLVNHLFAKIDDLEIGEGTVVAQTASQCFDISLWQLVSALLVGGRTLLFEQEVILDAKRFVDQLADGRVNVVQVVPSYLEVVVSHLEQHPRELPDLRYVSVTGEALKKALTQRWFAAEPGIKLVNAYGLTETSDDTNHEIMGSAPQRERVPLGRPVNNVRVYIVDEHLSPVPLGAPGEIVVSGVCVGRGYINDPERTRQAFLPDPHREGERLYRTGDYGRWLPDGKVEFLGRRDAQVKISGFRIEIGEIENRLLRLPQVREAAVVIVEPGNDSRRLVAFCSGEPRAPADDLRERLHASLPAYMVPSALHWLESLPLTDNGKIDRKALTALAGEIARGDGRQRGNGRQRGDERQRGNERQRRDERQRGDEPRGAPSTATEQRIAIEWARVLGIPKDQIGRRDHFFELGGTSLSALKLAVALDRAVSLKDLTEHPTLADLAALVDDGSMRQSRAAPARPPSP